jgi:alkylation response protein AidB-like acyl-CoA dehydrogenase
VDFNYSESHRMLLDSAERFLGARYTLRHRQLLADSCDGFDQEIWNAFADLGWLALAIPEMQGGLGGSIEDIAVLSTALGAKLVTEPFASTAVLATHILANAQEPRDNLLRAIASGQVRVALAHDEPNERYQYESECKSRVTRFGHELRLKGQKMLALDAPCSSTLIVTAHMEHEGIILALVDSSAEHVVHSSYPLIDGSRAADMRFDNVPLRSDAILARGARAQELLLEAVDRATVSLMAQAVGSMEACLQICSNYLEERQQFGQAIGKFQALQHIMADMFVATHQARSALYHALSNSDAPRAQRARAISLAKLTIDEASQLVSRQAIQLHGGYGITDEFEVSHHYRRLLVIEKLFGDMEFHVRRVIRD